jgi:hypothetical protein
MAFAQFLLKDKYLNYKSNIYLCASLKAGETLTVK